MRKFTENMTCDRCGATGERNTPVSKLLWRTIDFAGPNDFMKEHDICNACYNQFLAWWRAEAK